MVKTIGSIVLAIIAAAMIVFAVLYLDIFILVAVKASAAIVVATVVYWMGRYFSGTFQYIYDAWQIFFEEMYKQASDLFEECFDDGY